MERKTFRLSSASWLASKTAVVNSVGFSLRCTLRKPFSSWVIRSNGSLPIISLSGESLRTMLKNKICSLKASPKEFSASNLLHA
uniref:Uncharacterized protein n=1 Tax=Aeromonas hydrophila TaxID=644 RepID=Q5YL18_AERHY|nr:unknown [Aeromonas hydrophila]